MLIFMQNDQKINNLSKYFVKNGQKTVYPGSIDSAGMSRQNKRGPRPQSSMFLQVWSLYQTCRQTGTWARLVLENGDDSETF